MSSDLNDFKFTSESEDNSGTNSKQNKAVVNDLISELASESGDGSGASKSKARKAKGKKLIAKIANMSGNDSQACKTKSKSNKKPVAKQDEDSCSTEEAASKKEPASKKETAKNKKITSDANHADDSVAKASNGNLAEKETKKDSDQDKVNLISEDESTDPNCTRKNPATDVLRSPALLDKEIVKCTACGKQVNHYDIKVLRRHPVLKVLVCKECFKFYGDGDFSQDDDGTDKYCRWCANGGSLYGCDFCSNQFCANCIRSNFGRSEFRKLSKNRKWKCYVCEPSLLEVKVRYCDKVLKFAHLENKRSKPARKDREIKKASLNIPLDRLGSDISVPTDWLPVAFESMSFISNVYSNKIKKLQELSNSGTKSTKQIVRKFTQIIDMYRHDLKKVILKVEGKYSVYIKDKMSTSGCIITVSDDDNDTSLESPIKLNSKAQHENGHITKPENEKSSVMVNGCKSPGVSDDAMDSQDLDMELPTQKVEVEESKKDSRLSPVVELKDLKTLAPGKSLSVKEEDESGTLSQECDAAAKNWLLQSDSQSSDASTIPNHSADEKKAKKKKMMKVADTTAEGKKAASKLDDTNAEGKKAASKSADTTAEGKKAAAKLSDNTAEDKKAASKLADITAEDKKAASKLADTTAEDKEAASALHSDSDVHSDSGASTCSDSKFVKKSGPKSFVKRTKPKKETSSLFMPEDIVGKDEYKDKKINKWKLGNKPVVVVEKMSKTAINEYIALNAKKVSPESKDKDELIKLKKSVKNLTAPIQLGKKRPHPGTKDSDKPKPLKKAKKPAPKEDSSASSSFTLSSEDEERRSSLFTKKNTSRNINDIAKEELLKDESSSVSDSDSSVIFESPKKKKQDKSKKNGTSKSKSKESSEESSSDDFQPSKAKKSDKLLKVSMKGPGEGKSKGKKDGSEKEKDDKKKGVKRKIVYSDDSERSEEESSSELSSSDSDDSSTDGKKSKKKKGAKSKRRRVKVAKDSSNEDEKKKDDDDPNSQGTPGKGRKNIRKIISDKKVNISTREAQEAERERMKRIADRQKLYNRIVDEAPQACHAVTRKMVLEVDPESKEEIVEIHPDIVEKLKPHQVNGVKFMWECTIESVKLLKEGKPGSGGILAHCMGLGKTLQVIAFLHTVLTNKIVKKHIRTALIVCPYNTVLNWEAEFEKWLDDIGGVNVYNMTSIKTVYDRSDYLAQWQEEGGVMIIGYTLFARLVEGKIPKASKKTKAAVYENICDPGADVIVCDEGHMLKNCGSKLSQAANKVKTMRRIVLTGTPLQNNLKEYHCMMSFVKPNLLGTPKEFLNRFVNPITNGQYDDSSKHDVKLMKKRVHILHKLLEGCVQRCDYSALTKFLPVKHEFVISVQLSDVQIKLYRKFLEKEGCSGDVDSIKREGRLFTHYSALRNIWTYPYNLFLAFLRDEHKRFLNDQHDDDDDGESIGSFIDDRSSLSEKDSDDSAGPSKKRSSSSDEEVSKTYVTRSRGGGDLVEPEVAPAKPPVTKEWFYELITEEDRYKIETSGKMVLLLDILKECERIGDKVLVFSQSLITLDMIEDMLEHLDETASESEAKGESDDVLGSWTHGLDYFRMDGTVNVDLRSRWFEIFNDHSNTRARLFLISTKAGSLGANLVGANRVVMMDASWNPSHDVQAIFRVYRFGQIKPVYVYRFLAQGTMEEKIYNRQVTKLSLSIRVVDEQQIDRHYNAADLAELYRFEPDTSTDRPTPMVPNDRLLADILMRRSQWIVKYHEHDSLLQSTTEDDLTEEERQAAWQEYENEKDGVFINQDPLGDFANAGQGFNMGDVIPNPDSCYAAFQKEIRAKQPGLDYANFMATLSKYMRQLKTFYQNHHAVELRKKQQYISASIVVPPTLTQKLMILEQYISKTENLTNMLDKQVSELQKQQQKQQQPNQFPYRMSWNNMPFSFVIRQPGNQPGIRVFRTTRPQFRFAQGSATVPPGASSQNNAAPKEAPTIVDITSDKDADNIACSSSDPVVTLVEDVPSTENEPSNSAEPSKNKSDVQITEIE